MTETRQPTLRPIPLFMSEIEAMGGAERSVLALGRWLSRHARPVYLLTYYDRIGLEQYADFPLPTVELNPAPTARAKVAALAQHLRERGASAPPPLTSGYQPALHCALARAGAFHCLMHDTPSLFGGDSLGLKQRLRFAISNWQIGRGLRRGGGAVIVTSEFLQRECRRDFGVQAEIARMGGLEGRHSFRRRPVEGELRLLSVSRIEANKRIDWMLEALAALENGPTPLSSRVNWRLDITGKGSALEAMTARARELGLAHRVHFHGFVPDAQLQEFYDGAHLFLMPAVQGYGIPAIEALERGIPVLLHRESGVSDILLDTPWASVLTSGKETMAPRLEAMLDWLLRNGQMTAPEPPALPTEDTWAERVSRICGYV